MQLNRLLLVTPGRLFILISTCALLLAQGRAATLPEDRADVDYHRYDGGGVEVNGPSVQVRKGIQRNLSLYGAYYADSISSASIDVVTTASPYDEHRNEFSVGTDYLHGDTIMSIAAIASDENDYQARTIDVNVTQETLSGTTTLNLGYTRGWDEIERVDNDFAGEIDRHHYRLGMTQMVSPTARVNIGYEAITDRGFLANPYRSARLLGASVPERYPGTRTSNAIALRGAKYVAQDTATRIDYRYFWDTWNIKAHTVELGVNRHLTKTWLSELRYRYYTQSEANFYSDNFSEELNYMARDKELASLASHSLGFSLSYRLTARSASDSTVSFAYDYINYDYENFTDVRNGQLYSYDAHVLQLNYSLHY